GRALEDGAARREAAIEGDEAADRLDRRLARAHDGAVDEAGIAFEPLAQRLARDREAVEVEERLQLAQHGADAAGSEEVLHVELPGRLQVDDDRRRVGELVEALKID